MQRQDNVQNVLEENVNVEWTYFIHQMLVHVQYVIQDQLWAVKFKQLLRLEFNNVYLLVMQENIIIEQMRHALLMQ